MKHITTITIPALSGKKQIKDSKLFKYIDSDFDNWNITNLTKSTSEIKVDVLKLDKDVTFKEMFVNPDKMCLTQEQILYFIKNNKKLLNSNWTFFLLKSNNDFFVAHVSVASGGLEVYVYRFGSSCVWDAESRHHLVATKLAETLTPKSLSLEPFDPLKLEFTYDGIKYKIVKE